MEVEIHATTGIGPIRKWNEDNYLLLNLTNSEFRTKPPESEEYVIKSYKFEVDEKGVVLAVSDGCGGAGAGDVSSSVAVETVKNMLTGEIPSLDDSFYQSELIKKLYESALYATLSIHNYQRTNRDYSGMGCTFTAVGITPDVVDFLQVGDIRGYLIRKGKIYQITKDQTLISQLIDNGEISQDEAETHPLKNVILAALGAQNEIYPVCLRLIPQKDDSLLLCSDGLTNHLTNVDLLRVVQKNLDDLENACGLLIQEANERGGYDNITVILAKLSGSDSIESDEKSVIVYPLKFPKIEIEN